MNHSCLVKTRDNETLIKEILLFDNPASIRPLLNQTAWKILLSLAQKPKYPAEVAKELGIYRQKIYYYTKQLERTGLIKSLQIKNIQGGLAKYYTVSYPAFGVELPFGAKKSQSINHLDPKLESFLKPIVQDKELTGFIVVGSPEPHGPNKTVARDGHYAVQLGLFLGQFCKTPSDFAVKLDVDIKNEKCEAENMILIGGPGTNLITNSVNSFLPSRFNDKDYWTGISDGEGNVYTFERDGIVAKIPNPKDERKSIIVLAGNRSVGTKSAILSLTNFWKKLLKEYHGEDRWSTIVRGFDMDGDGKIDAAEVVY